MTQRICSIDGCEREAVKRGWCNRHYRRWWLHGDANWQPRVASGRPRKPRAKLPLPTLSEIEAAWLAGIFEGEGTIIMTKGTHVRLVIGMTDRDVIERIEALVPMPTGPRTKKQEAHYKEQWIWYTQRGPTVKVVLEAMLPWLGERRRARALAALALLGTRKPPGHYGRSKTHCPQGHPYDEENTYVNAKGLRSCKICTRQRAQRYEQRARAARARRLAVDPRSPDSSKPRR